MSVYFSNELYYKFDDNLDKLKLIINEKRILNLIHLVY